MAEAPAQPDQWWSAFPAPRSKAPEISADEVMQMFEDMDVKSEPRSFLLVDVRRTDWEVSSASQHFKGPLLSKISFDSVKVEPDIFYFIGWNHQDVS